MQRQSSVKRRILLYSLLCALTVFGGARLYYRLTDDFRLGNIKEEINYRPEWEIPLPSEEESQAIGLILKQPFTYIGKGAQSYAFGSADGQYVLKFFKFKHLRPSPFLSWLPSWEPIESYRKKQAARKERKFEGVFSGYHLAYSTHKADSGLIFLHLNKTNDQFPNVILIDKMGLRHNVDLDDVVFLIQRRAETLRTVFNKLLDDGKLDLAKQRIDQIFDLYLSEYQKGIYDHDHGVMHNAGFAGDQPIHLDVGKLKKDDQMRQPEVYSKDIVLVANRMGSWLKQNRPNEYEALAKHIEAKVSSITGQPFKLD